MNMTKEVVVIPATTLSGQDYFRQRQLRVASYSRVSTDSEDQLISFHAQRSYYTDMIHRNPLWKLAGTFADEGISGASAEKRPEFMKMIAKCKRRKIDLIITKSISRFARNTLDSIKYVRMLKSLGIGVLFEKENINTLEETSEVILTILASLAQEELNSLSLNVKMGMQMRMREGKVTWNYKQCYGFRQGEDGEPEIIPEHAEVIREIFKWYIMGHSEEKIVKEMTDSGTMPITQSGKWSTSVVRSILLNERMCGDVILQKTYISDPISKKVIVNNGERPKVHIKNNHPAIVERSVYERAQTERSRRSSKRKISTHTKTEQGKYSSLYALTGMLVCGNCGTEYRRVHWKKRSGEKQILWRCVNRLDHGRKYCTYSPSIEEASLKNAILAAIARSDTERRENIEYLTKYAEKTLWAERSENVDVEDIERQIAGLKAQVMDYITSGTAGQNIAKMEQISAEAKALNDVLNANRQSGGTEQKIRDEVDGMRAFLESESATCSEWNESLIRQLIHTVKVMDESTIRVYFRCGYECEQKMEVKVRSFKAAG